MKIPRNKKLSALTVCMLGAFPAAHATDYDLGNGVQASVNATASLGSMIRADSPNPNSYTFITSQVPSVAAAGVAPGNLIGLTDSSDTNFKKNRPVSTLLKANLDVDVHGKDYGVFVRASAWKDFELSNGSRPYGNYANGYTAGARLSDNGFAPEAKFSNLMLRDAYAYGAFDLTSDAKLKVRLGRQTLDWGKSMLTPGGINAAINPLDLASSLRPGALPEEGKVPTGMLALSLAASKTWGADAFIKLENRTPAFPGCGTFFDVASLVPQGCNLAGAIGNASPFPASVGTPLTTVASLSEPAIFSSGYYVHRAADVNPSGSGQWGLSLRYLAETLNTEFRGYALNTSSTVPGFHIYTPTAAMSTTTPVNAALLPAAYGPTAAMLNYAFNALASPNGMKYAVAYASNVHLFGLSFDTKLAPMSRLYGEVAVRTNAQMNWNGNDMLTAALTPAVANPALTVGKGVAAVPLGGGYDAFDRLRVTTASLGGSQVFPKTMGAERVVVVAELGLSHVDGLPDANVMRYGRAFSYGTAPWVTASGALSACAETVAANGIPKGVPGKTCSTNGFVTSDSAGLRLNVSARYPDAMFGATLTPSLYIAQDLSGYAYDGSYVKDRMTVRPSLRAEWGKSYFLDIAYTRFSGGDYSMLIDRSNYTIVGGMKF